jgi:hypothetical protein
MTVTREQAQMLTSLAIACRPHRAPTWDAPGIMATIGQMRDWSLPEVALRVIVAAADREAKTPAVMCSPSMQIPEPKAPLWQPTNRRDDEGRCSECGLPRAACESRPRFGDDDHGFTSIAANRAVTAATATEVGAKARVGGLRDIKATDPTPAVPVGAATNQEESQ